VSSRRCNERGRPEERPLVQRNVFIVRIVTGTSSGQLSSLLIGPERMPSPETLVAVPGLA
jgi:hypothetical protein